MNNRHRVFVSYYHDEDQDYREQFEGWFSDIYDIYVSESVGMGEIIRERYLRKSTVTVVLVGGHTWQRKFVDWEIGSSIRDTEFYPRSGLLGILLPNYPGFSTNTYNPYTIPPRLHDNIECCFAKIYRWSNNPSTVQEQIHEAFERRNEDPPPINSRDTFRRNRSGERWYD